MALFNKQKQDKPKKPESIIGKIIYGFLLFAPLLAILTASMVNIFNENAYTNNNKEVDIQYKYESNEVTTIDDLVDSNIYEFNFGDYSFDDFFEDGELLIEPLTNVIVDVTGFDESYYTNEETILVYNSFISITYSTTVFYYAIEENDTDYYYASYLGQPLNSFVGRLLTTNNSLIMQQGKTNISGFISYTDYNEIENVEITETETASEDIFYTACNKVEQSNLFNWSKTTGTYTVLTNVCESIGITNTFTPMLMAYWLLISVIYFLFDIALILIWAVHDKIHALKDAI